MANDAGGSRNGVDKHSPSAPPALPVENAEYKYGSRAPRLDAREFEDWSFYRATMTEFLATLLYQYVTVATVIGHVHASEMNPYGGVGTMGIAWSFGGMFFVLVYCTAGLSGGHINPAITFGRFVGRKVTLNRAVIYMVAQCAGTICGAGIVKSLQKTFYSTAGGGANSVAPGYTKITALVAEIIGTFVLVYTVFTTKDDNREDRDRILGPLAIGFAVFVVILATIPISGTGSNPARSFGAAVIYNHKHSWDDQWIFWLGPLIGATLAAGYHEYVIPFFQQL